MFRTIHHSSNRLVVPTNVPAHPPHQPHPPPSNPLPIQLHGSDPPSHRCFKGIPPNPKISLLQNANVHNNRAASLGFLVKVSAPSSLHPTFPCLQFTSSSDLIMTESFLPAPAIQDRHVTVHRTFTYLSGVLSGRESALQTSMHDSRADVPLTREFF